MPLFYQWAKQFLTFGWACTGWTEHQSQQQLDRFWAGTSQNPHPGTWQHPWCCMFVSHDNLRKYRKSEWCYEPRCHARGQFCRPWCWELCHAFGFRTSCLKSSRRRHKCFPLSFWWEQVPEQEKSRNPGTVILFLVPTRYGGLAQIHMASLFWGALNFNVSAEMGITRISEVPNALKINWRWSKMKLKSLNTG